MLPFAGQYWLLSKGAENSMRDRSARRAPMNDIGAASDKSASGSMRRRVLPSEWDDQVMQRVGDYALEGLRTLVIARRPLSDSEFRQMDMTLEKARLALTDREAAVRALHYTVSALYCIRVLYSYEP